MQGFLSPIECERLNGFDDNWTEGMSNRARYFTMGNALIVGVVSEIIKNIKSLPKETINFIKKLTNIEIYIK